MDSNHSDRGERGEDGNEEDDQDVEEMEDAGADCLHHEPDEDTEAQLEGPWFPGAQPVWEMVQLASLNVHLPPCHPDGDDMARMPRNACRTGTLNIGHTISRDAWKGYSQLIVAEMIRWRAVILFVQELHIWEEEVKLISDIKGWFHELGYRISIQGQSKDRNKDRATRASTGVAIVTPHSWLEEPKRVYRESGSCAGRCIAMTAAKALPTEANASLPSVSNAPPRKNLSIGLVCIYGPTGHTTKTSEDQDVIRRELADHAMATIEHLEEETDVIIAGLDANSVDLPIVDLGPGTEGTNHEDGILSILINDLDFTDATRVRTQEGVHIATHCGHQEGSVGSNIDRLVVKGANVLQAGWVEAAHLPHLGVDHALVLVDIDLDMPALVDAPRHASQPNTAPARFLAQAANYKVVDGVSFEGKVRSCTAHKVIREAMRIQEQAKALCDNPEDMDPQRFKDVKTSLSGLCSSFMTKVYDPIIRAHSATSYSGAPWAHYRPDKDRDKHISRLEVRAACNVKATAVVSQSNASALHQRYNTDSSTVCQHNTHGLIVNLQEAWVTAVIAHQGCSRTDAINTEVYRKISNRVAGCMVTRDWGCEPEDLYYCQRIVRSAIRTLVVQEQLKRDDEWREAVEDARKARKNKILFRMLSAFTPIPPATTVTQYRMDGQVRDATTLDERLLGTRQKWEPLYNRNMWTAPPFFKKTVDPITGYDKVELDQEVDVPRLSPPQQIALKAIKLCESDCMNWDGVRAPIKSNDFQHMFRARVGRCPGASGFKIAAMRYFPQEAQDALEAIMQAMWTHCIIPQDLLHTKIVLLPKPNGGERGISLIEELVKALDTLLQQRIIRGLKAGRKLEEFLSDFNRAYKPGMSCADILHAHAAIIEDAVSRNAPLACIMQDLAKFYDTVQLDEVEVVLRMKGAPDWVISMIRAFYHKSTVGIACQYGETTPIERQIGIQQGSALSCLLCLVAIEPYLRLLHHDQQQNTGDIYVVHGDTEALPRCYSDDNCDYTNSVHGMRRKLADTAPALHVFGIGVDDKIIVIAFNIDLANEENRSISFETYDRDTGGTKILTAQVRDGKLEEYRLLGAFFKGAHVNMARASTVLRTAKAALTRLKGQRLSPRTASMIIQARIISGIVGHSPLTTSMTVETLAEADTAIANVARNSAHVSVSAPRGMVFADTRSMGLGFASATAELVASTARELIITLNAEGYEGELTRGSYKMGLRHAYHHSIPGAQPGFIHRAVLLLAGYGFYLHCSSEDTVSRALMVAYGEADGGHEAHMIARADESRRSIEHNRQYAPNGMLALKLRARLMATGGATSRAHPFDPHHTTVEWLRTRNDPRPSNKDSDLLFRKARKQSGDDWASFCACLSLKEEVRRGDGAVDHRDPINPAAQDTRIALLRTSSLKESVCDALQQQRDRAPGYEKFLFTATDGSDRGGATVVLAPTEEHAHGQFITGISVEAQRDLLNTLYNKQVASGTTYRSICEITTQVPEYIGCTKTSSFETECCALIPDLLIRRKYAMGPLFMDSEPVQAIAGAKANSLSQRKMIKQGRSYLVNVINYLKSLAERHDQSEIDTLFWERLNMTIKAVWSTDYKSKHYKDSLVQVCAGDTLKHSIVKTKSHQDDPNRLPVPCTAAVFGNESADKLADIASKREVESSSRNIIIPPFLNAFELLHKGKLVGTYYSKYIREQCKLQSGQYVTEEGRCGTRAIPFRIKGAVHQGAQDLLAIDAEIGETASHKHMLRMHSSWTYMHHSGQIPKATTRTAYEILYADELTTNKILDYKDIPDPHLFCPLCLAEDGAVAHGKATHYLSLQCTDQRVRESLLAFYAAMEKHLMELGKVSVDAWIRHAKRWTKDKDLNKYDTPANVKIFKENFPILHHIQWLVNVSGERLSDLREDGDLLKEELVWSCGMRAGTLPASFCLPGQERFSTEQALQLEAFKLKELMKHSSLCKEVLWEAKQQQQQVVDDEMTRRREEAEAEQDNTNSAPVQICVVQGCEKPQRCGTLCSSHDRHLRQAMAGLSISKNVLHPPRLMQQAVTQRDRGIITPCSVSQYISTVPGQAQHPSANYQSLCLPIFRDLFIPFTRANGGPRRLVKWTGSKDGSFCGCPVMASSDTRQGKVTTCDRCNRLRIHPQPAVHIGSHPSCGVCNKAIAANEAMQQCNGCARQVHSPLHESAVDNGRHGGWEHPCPLPANTRQLKVKRSEGSGAHWYCPACIHAVVTHRAGVCVGEYLETIEHIQEGIPAHKRLYHASNASAPSIRDNAGIGGSQSTPMSAGSAGPGASSQQGSAGNGPGENSTMAAQPEDEFMDVVDMPTPHEEQHPGRDSSTDASRRTEHVAMSINISAASAHPMQTSTTAKNKARRNKGQATVSATTTPSASSAPVAKRPRSSRADHHQLHSPPSATGITLNIPAQGTWTLPSLLLRRKPVDHGPTVAQSASTPFVPWDMRLGEGSVYETICKELAGLPEQIWTSTAHADMYTTALYVYMQGGPAGQMGRQHLLREFDLGTELVPFLQGIPAELLSTHEAKEGNRCLLIHAAAGVGENPLALLYACREFSNSAKGQGYVDHKGVPYSEDAKIALQEILLPTQFVSHDILGLIRLDMLSKSSVHVISGLDDNSWRIASYHPYPAGNRMNCETKEVLLLHRANHYTLLEPATGESLQRDKAIRSFVRDFKNGCRTLHPPELEEIVITEHFADPAQRMQRVRGGYRA